MKNRKTFRLGSSRGQSMVELGLLLPFILILVGSVVDFGIAIFAGQVAEFAARDAARLGATLPPADPAVKVYPADELGSCTAPSCSGEPSQILQAAGERIPSIGLFESFTVTAEAGDVGGEEAVTVTVAGTYDWAFLWMIGVPSFHLIGESSFPSNLEIARSTSARWEWQ